ncbi:alkaline phosphatase [Chitinophaga caeni]|uniref:Alkaline phosphatase n=1 Tax=Chitinophaga caeni TaxID=2029983 RepID=A0A291R0C6_9BACT|nr:alkaline phosphatase [Chitinophaga caeni]ATL49553.1 alkaline phosphatase [Chitinophaga caeni]
MKHLLFGLCLAFLSFPAFAQSKGVKGVKHVILIGLDGFGSYSIPKAEMPRLKEMMQQGSWTIKARNVLPTSSAVNWASLLMGASPEIHGYTEWNSRKPEIPSRVVDQFGMFPSIFTLLYEQKPKYSAGVIYTWEGIGYLFPKQTVKKDVHCESDSMTTAVATDYIKNEKPNFLFIHFDQPDETGHKIGHDTPEYYAQLKIQDQLIGKILDAIKESGTWDETIVMLTADHGGINKGHGGKTLQEIEIPWLIMGKGIKKNQEIQETVNTFDTAATIAYIFGLKVPQAWIGRNVRTAFTK